MKMDESQSRIAAAKVQLKEEAEIIVVSAYLHSASHEMYAVRLPRSLDGLPFAVAAAATYAATRGGAVLFATTAPPRARGCSTQ